MPRQEEQVVVAVRTYNRDARTQRNRLYHDCDEDMEAEQEARQAGTPE